MPNQPKTPTRTIRVSTELWNDSKAQAAEDGFTLTAMITTFLEGYTSAQRAKRNAA